MTKEKMNINLNLIAAKEALDKVIQKGRVHLYKPIQIAEILHHSRNQLVPIDIEELDTYRNASKKWRDAVSMRLVGGKSTSSAKFQDNLFDNNAMPPKLLKILDQENQIKKGVVENYIYHGIKTRLAEVTEAYNYLVNSSSKEFSLQSFLDFFEYKSGLKRSVDKAYEIVVYALFSTLVEELNAKVSLTLDNPDPKVFADFALFVKYVLGIEYPQTTVIRIAKLYRVGVANAADSGLDMWANFGPAVQVKHLRLDADLADEIMDDIAIDEVVIVCRTAETQLIKSLLNQIGQPIKGIITQDDLMGWYDLCLTKYQNLMGDKIIKHLRREFIQEFPAVGELESFLQERFYDESQLTDDWQLL